MIKKIPAPPPPGPLDPAPIASAKIAAEPPLSAETGEIPFTQYLLPDGRKRQEYVDRPVEIASLAQQFIDNGGWYECEMLSDMRRVSFTACMNVDDEPQDVECEICDNGPAVMDAVDRLVRASIKHIGDAP